ncbi:hypothetical protein ACK3Y4_04795 [Aeromonas caviae]
MKKILSLIATATLSCSVLASPAINIGAMHNFMESERNTILKQVRNSGSSTAYVRISAFEIDFSSAGKPVEKTIDNDALMQGKGLGLLVSPARMIIPASGNQANRMLFVGARDRERYYRVRYVPVIPETGKEFGLSAAEQREYEAGLKVGVNMMAGYGAIVVVRPAHVRYHTQIDEDAGNVVITNKGNSTVMLDAFAQCKAQLKECHNHKVHYLRPGISISHPKEAGKSFQFTLVEGERKKRLAFGQM